MWSRAEPMPPPPALRPLVKLTPTPAQQQIQTILHGYDAWLDRLVAKYGLPRAVLVRMLDRPGALEDEIASLICEWAERTARDLFMADAPPPADSDLFSRAVRGVHARFVRQQEAAEAAEKQRQYEATDRLLARVRAGEDIDDV
jgi:hypothetical protein